MALRVCGITRFRQCCSCCQASGGLTGHRGGQTGHALVLWTGMMAGGQTGRGGGLTGLDYFVSLELGQK